MKLLTLELRAQLIHNNQTAREFDHIPVVKWFTPWANATWIVTEMEPDGRCFGLCDVGQGTPELGYVSVEELESIRGPAGLRIERDLHFATDKPLSAWTSAARSARRIVEPGEQMLNLRTQGFWVSSDKHADGVIVDPKNWGRIVRAEGQEHPHYQREADLEAYRLKHYPQKPSRLGCNFICQELEHALWHHRRFAPASHLYEIRFDSETLPYHQAMIACLPPLRDRTYEQAIKHYWDCDLSVHPDDALHIAPIEVLTVSPLLIVRELAIP